MDLGDDRLERLRATSEERNGEIAMAWVGENPCYTRTLEPQNEILMQSKPYFDIITVAGPAPIRMARPDGAIVL